MEEHLELDHIDSPPPKTVTSLLIVEVIQQAVLLKVHSDIDETLDKGSMTA